jgi:CDP-glucose 4,6-dehydratase
MSSEFWYSRRVFVTGATGIVGSWLVKELLEKGANVVALIRDADPQSELYRSGDINKISVVNGSLEDFYALKRVLNEQEIETVFHLGAQTIVGAAYRDPFHTFEVNIRGTYNLLEACRLHSDLVKRVVVASSDKAYGDSKVLPYTEDMPPLGRHPYDVSKSCTDLIAQTYSHTYKLPIIIARCGNIYGGGDLNWSRIIPGTIQSLFAGNRPIIRSDGTFIRDYIYVKDAVNAYMLMAEALDRSEVQGEAFNFSPAQPRTVIEIVNIIRQLMNKENIEPLILNQVKAEIRDQYLSSQKAEQVLGWFPLYSLEKGLSETIVWYEKFFGKSA